MKETIKSTLYIMGQINAVKSDFHDI